MNYLNDCTAREIKYIYVHSNTLTPGTQLRSDNVHAFGCSFCLNHK